MNGFVGWLIKQNSFLLNITLILLFLDVIIDPNNLIFHLKYILFVLVLLFWIPQVVQIKVILPKEIWVALFFIAVFMPLYGISVGFLNHTLHNTPLTGFAYFNSFFFFVLVMVVLHQQINLQQYFNNAVWSIVIITIGVYLILLINTQFFGSLYKYFVVNKQVAVYALRKYGDNLVLMIFYKTSPLLVFPFSYYLYRLFYTRMTKKTVLHLLFILLLATTLFLSGTRANMVSMVLIVIFYITAYVFKQSRLWFVLFISMLLLIFVLSVPWIQNVLLNRYETSNLIKFGYFSSYAQYFSDHIFSLLLGQGIGGSFYASGLHEMTAVTELTYLELFRVWGIPVALMFIGILFMPLLAELKAGKLSHIFIAYLAYLFIAGTNPLLMSSTGMLVLVYVFSSAFGDNMNNLNLNEVE